MDPKFSEDKPEHEKEENVEVDEELKNPDLYEDSMAEITFNETTMDGEVSDPFDRSGEYDEDIDFQAPPPTTPDIPEHPEEVQPVTSSPDSENPFDD